MYTFDDLVGIIAKLRSPEGCPWDREQTFESLKKCLADETEEVFQAIDNKDMENLCEELGDVLLQVILNSQIAKEEGRFTIDDVIDGLCRKMVRRHPPRIWRCKGEFRGGRNRPLESDKNAGKSQKTLTNHSKTDIND